MTPEGKPETAINLMEHIRREVSSPVAFVPWLQVIAAERGSKPLSERDAEHLSVVAQGIVDQAAEIERLREWLGMIAEVHDIRADIFTNDADCAASLADRARAALQPGRRATDAF